MGFKERGSGTLNMKEIIENYTEFRGTVRNVEEEILICVRNFGGEKLPHGVCWNTVPVTDLILHFRAIV